MTKPANTSVRQDARLDSDAEFGIARRGGCRRTRSRRLLGVPALAAVLAATLGLALVPAAQADVGFVDGSYGFTSAPTGMKPQSKLWYTSDGTWWGLMYNGFTAQLEIHRRVVNGTSETWSTNNGAGGTNAVVDGRRNTWSDAKWDGAHLFVVTHGAGWESTLDGMKLRRFSYNATSKTWSLDNGYPLLNVGITPGHDSGTATGTEGAVLDVDSRGRVWLTWTRDGKAWVTHSTTDTRTYVTPFAVPVPNSQNLTTDDMSTLVAFDGRIGVLWSNEAVGCMCFAIHNDGDPDGVWTEKPMLGPATDPADKQQELADDHMNLKAPNDGSGYVYAASKTSLDGMSDPLLLLNVFNGSSWTNYTYSTVADQTTRAQIALDMQHQQLYMFNSSPCCNGGIEYYKQTSIKPGRIAFGPGLGTPFMSSAANPNVNNVSTTKQTVDASSGLVAIAGDDSTHTYLHNTIDLTKADTTPPDTTIDSGPVGTDNNPDAQFSFSSTESESTFECRLDSAPFALCTSPKRYTDVGDGPHTFSVRAIDAVGNVDPTPASRNWTVENTATVINVTADMDSYVDSGTPTTTRAKSTTLTTDKASSSSPQDKQSFFRFTIPPNHKLVSAKLRAWVTDGTTDGPQIYSTSSNWDEKTLTWNNKPAPTGTALDDRGAVAKNAYVEYDVTSSLPSGAPAATPASFVTILNTGTDALVVASKENTTVNKPPVLQLRVDPPPDTNIISAPDSATTSTSANFAFDSTDPSSTFACKLDAGAYAPCSSPMTYGGLSDGTHTFSVKATTAQGTDPSPAAYTWTVDTVAPPRPAIALSAGSDTGASSSDRVTADATPTLTGTAEAGGVVSVYGDGSELGSVVADAAGNWSFAGELLSDGMHTFSAEAHDVAGNYSSRSADLVVQIDTTAPAAPTITDPAGDLVTSNRDVHVTGTAAADAESVELRDGSTPAVPSAPVTAGAWSADVAGLSDGAHDISAVAHDLAGNASAPSASRTVTVDTVAPDTTITSKPPNPSRFDSTSFSFASTDAGSSFACQLDAGGWAACTSPHPVSGLSDGSHTFAVRATDPAGNVDPVPASYTWTVNTGLPPRPTITSPADGSWSNSATVTVSGSADPSVQSVQLLDGGALVASTAPDPSTGAWSITANGLADGAHTFTATATTSDDPPLTTAPSDPVTVKVDTVAPTTAIDDKPADPSNTTTAGFRFSSNDTSASYECRVDGSAFASCPFNYELTGLADGRHTIEVRAVDLAGNADPTPETYSWTVNTAAPDTTIDAGPSGVVESSQASFSFSSSEPASTFQCQLDGGGWAGCTSPKDLDGLAAGAHTFTVRAIDDAGNVDPTPAVRTWQVRLTVLADSFDGSSTFGSAWTRQVGADGTAAVVTDVFKSAPNAARLSATANTGSFAILRYNLPSVSNDLIVEETVMIEAEGLSGGNIPLLRLFDSAGTRVLSVYRQNVNADRLYVNYNNTAFTTTGRLAVGAWGRFVIHAATSGALEVSLNDSTIFQTSTAALGTGIATVQLGNDTKKQPFRLVTDDVKVKVQ